MPVIFYELWGFGFIISAACLATGAGDETASAIATGVFGAPFALACCGAALAAAGCSGKDEESMQGSQAENPYVLMPEAPDVNTTETMPQMTSGSGSAASPV